MIKRFSAPKIRKTTFLDPDEILADSFSSLGSSASPESKLEQSISRLPSILFTVIMTIGMSYLIYRAVNLQVVSGKQMFAKSQENRFLVRTIFPPRGIIYDRNGQALVENVSSFGLVFQRDQFLNKKGDLSELLKTLGKELNQPVEYFYELGFPDDNSPKKLPSQIFISQDLPTNLVVSLTPQLDTLPGIEIFESYKRVYKDPLADSNLIGYIGKISQDDLTSNPDLGNQETIGKNGIEAYYDHVLRGVAGEKIIEIDSKGKETNFKYTKEPKAGSDIHLTIDEDMQKKAYELLEHYTGRKNGGSFVVADPKDGSIRALVSYPGFDSNSFSYNLTQKEFTKVLNDPLKPFFNRAIAGEFPSGSIIKPIIASAALQEKIIDPEKKIYDPGYIEVPNPYGQKAIFADWQPQGWINIYDAIAMSANVYFYTIGGGYGDQKGLGIDNIKKYDNLFGLGSKTGVDIPGEKAGFVPDPTTKKTFDPNNPIWRIGDTYNVSIGQGGLKVTPLQMTMAASSIANGGTLYKPHILTDLNPEIVRQGFIAPENLKMVIKGMRQAVTTGTVRRLANLQVEVAAKTGTAQTNNSHLPHSWGMIIAPAENPELAVISMVEYGGEGYAMAIPVADDFFKWYFNGKK